jgi:DnaK suppressor protein
MARKDAFQKQREILLNRRQALRQALQGDESLLRELEQSSGGDSADLASDSTKGEISSQLIEVSHRELECIEQALQKMKDGKYGRCAACSRNIPVDRLEALPFAIYCVGCQRAAESAGVEPGKVVDWSLIIDQPNGGVDYSIKIN